MAKAKDDFDWSSFDPGSGEDWSGWNPGDFSTIPDWSTSPPDFGNSGAGTIAPGDSAQGGGGIDPGSGTIPFDQASFARLLQGLGGGGSSSGIGSILSRLVGGNGSNGLNSLLPLLIPGLASIYSGVSGNNAINHARDDMLHGIDQANQSVQSAYDKSNGLFNPYISAGTNALAGLQGMQGSNLASQFQPLGSGRSLKSMGGK